MVEMTTAELRPVPRKLNCKALCQALTKSATPLTNK